MPAHEITAIWPADGLIWDRHGETRTTKARKKIHAGRTSTTRPSTTTLATTSSLGVGVDLGEDPAQLQPDEHEHHALEHELQRVPHGTLDQAGRRILVAG